MIAEIPDRYFWRGGAELDALVLNLLESSARRLTGRKLGGFLGTTDRTIRKSISRLREAGHEIDASMKPPRGYWLNE